MLIFISYAYSQECLGTRESCCSSLDCQDYCADNFTRKYAGVCRVKGEPCVYATQFCEYGCENGTCKSPCAAKFLDEYRCEGNWVQRAYQHPDCSISWKYYEYCTYGCLNGTCKGLCTPGFLDEYKCEGSSRYRKYQDENCTITWKFWEDCLYGCLNGTCLAENITEIPEEGEEKEGGKVNLEILLILIGLVAIIFFLFKTFKPKRRKK